MLCDSELVKECPLIQAIIPNKVFIAQNVKTSFGKGYHCFETRKTLKYYPLCDDFGPMNMACVIRFIETLEDNIREHPTCKIIYCVPKGRRALSNGVFLMGAYLMLVRNATSADLANTFSWLDNTLIEHFRDATHLKSDFDLTLMDCWRGLEQGRKLGWISTPKPETPSLWGQIDVDEYEHYDDPMNGDLHIVVPGKFVAFKGPRYLDGRTYFDDGKGYRHFSAGYYADIFRSIGVTAVVRLNESQYDPADFTSRGIRHAALEFEDCTPPPPSVVGRFVAAVAASPRGGAVAVHCKAGLGRTGTLIALHMMRFCGFGAREAMGWLRIMRPGSVIGEQQRYLCDVEASLASPPPALIPAPRSISKGRNEPASTATSGPPPPAGPATVSPPLGPSSPSCASVMAAQVAAGMERRGAARGALRAVAAVAAAGKSAAVPEGPVAGGGAAAARRLPSLGSLSGMTAAVAASLSRR